MALFLILSRNNCFSVTNNNLRPVWHVRKQSSIDFVALIKSIFIQIQPGTTALSVLSLKLKNCQVESSP